MTALAWAGSTLSLTPPSKMVAAVVVRRIVRSSWVQIFRAGRTIKPPKSQAVQALVEAWTRTASPALTGQTRAAGTGPSREARIGLSSRAATAAATIPTAVRGGGIDEWPPGELAESLHARMSLLGNADQRPHAGPGRERSQPSPPSPRSTPTPRTLSAPFQNSEDLASTGPQPISSSWLVRQQDRLLERTARDRRSRPPPGSPSRRPCRRGLRDPTQIHRRCRPRMGRESTMTQSRARPARRPCGP